MRLKRKLNSTTLSVLGILFLIFSFSFTFSTSTKNNESPLALNIEHVVGDFPLVLDSLTYKNNLGQNFKVSKLKYYIGAILLKQENGKSFRCNDYFLINEEDPDSKHITLDHVPVAEYTSIEFMIGVDSLHNCSGAQSGALDPVHGMFWAWNSGYIFLKLEGYSPSSTSPGHIFEYHIGGYKQPNNCTRKVKLELNKSRVKQQQSISLRADILEILKEPQSVDFSKLSSVTDFHNASTIADNYKDMFSSPTN